MHRFNKTIQACIFAFVLLLAAPPDVAARSLQEASYPSDLVWATAVRFLRVDLRFPVLEKDKEAGYILFDYVQEAKVYKGALELVAFEEASGRAATRVAVSVPDLPRHIEAVLLEKLARKLKEELGSPAPVRSRPNKDDSKGTGEPSKRKPTEKQPDDADPNQPVRGEDGLPRLPTRELPRPQE